MTIRLSDYKSKQFCLWRWIKENDCIAEKQIEKSFGKSFGNEKSLNLKDFQNILNNKEVNFINLQYINNNIKRQFDEQIEEIELIKKFDIKNNQDIDNLNDIMSVAVLIYNCDFVITCSNSTAHLAGAINKKTFLLLP